jgi:TPR repeat protein
MLQSIPSQKTPSPARCTWLAWLFMGLFVLSGCSSSEFKSAKKRAEAGEAQAQYEVAIMCLEGKATKQSDAEGVKWCRKAADQGFAPAERFYGMLLRDGGASLNRNMAQARVWLEKAANKGDVQAQTELASMLGLFSPPYDYVEAMKWLLIADRKGSTNAAALMNLMVGQMSEAEKSQARIRAEAFGK